MERDEARAHRIELENILDAIRKVIEHGAVSPSLDVRSDAACAVLDMLRQLDREGAVETCHHEWIDIRNMAVESGEMCSKCRALRPGNATDVERQPSNVVEGFKALADATPFPFCEDCATWHAEGKHVNFAPG